MTANFTLHKTLEAMPIYTSKAIVNKVDEVQTALQWESVTAQAGEMLVFNSFIPQFHIATPTHHAALSHQQALI